MINEISDTRLQHYLKKQIEKLPYEKKQYLRSLLSCGVQVVRQTGAVPGVFLLTNGKDSKFFGHTSCKNAWACPVCAAKKMSKYATEIACAIDALKEKNQSAFMLTLTIPHTSGMSCEETTEILYNTWKNFITHGNKTVKANNLKGKDRRWKNNDVFASFCEQLNCKHRVRVGEFTYGNAGWHPHFHCLFWVDDNKFDKVLEWKEKFLERWLELAKRETLKYWNKINPSNKEKNSIRLNIMYDNLNTVSKAAYFSVDKEGKLIKQQSSNYICGWGADKELTGNIQNKASAEGHLTPHEILTKAANGNEKMLDLYIEYAISVKKHKHARINFSVHSGIRKIIRDYMRTNAYKECIKKKSIRQNEELKWKVLCWFTEKQWFNICELDRKFPIKHNILYLATLPNGLILLNEYLKFYGIDIIGNGSHHLNELVEKIFNPDFLEAAA